VQELAFLAGESEKPRRVEQGGPEVPWHQSRQALQFRRNRENQKVQEMVAGHRADSRLLERVAEIYAWLELRIRRSSDLAGSCSACGNCCDFDAFDHRLYVTGPELRYLAANLGGENIRAMPAGRCPYNVDGKCSVYEHRFAGCRIFCCEGDVDFQSELSESVLARLKSTSTEFHIPYRYLDLATALNTFADG
jgi:hypothetical protein